MTLMPVHLRAQTDQQIEAAREALPHIALVRDPTVAILLTDIVQFCNDAGADHLSARVRLLAVLELANQIRENPPCSGSSLPEWSP
jgi:hypothetical protein